MLILTPEIVLLRSRFLGSFLKPPIRTLKWQIKAPPVDPTEYLKKLKDNQIGVHVFERRFNLPDRTRDGRIPYLDIDLKGYNWLYDRIFDWKQRDKFPEIDIILIKSVSGVGVAGTKIRISGNLAYKDFILPQLAVYANPANEEKYRSVWAETLKSQPQFSSVTAEITVMKLSQLMLQLWMNMDSPWKIEKWHVRVAFRRMGVVVPEDCIELPTTTVTGPDISKEGKHFYVTVIINNKERVPVVCRINHFCKDIDKALPSVPLWTKPFDPLFDEDSESLKNLEPPDESNVNPYLSGEKKPFTVITS